MSNKSLNPRTEQLLKDWYLGNTSPRDGTQLISSLIGEMSETKQKQVDKIGRNYYRR